MALALGNLRVGRMYRLVNQGEVRKIEVMLRISDDNFKVKDLETLEVYTLEELLQWGRGKDFDLEEIIHFQRFSK